MSATIPRDAFTQRLDLLEDSDQVSAVARRLTLEFVDATEATFGVPLDEQNGAMLVTHLAMALTRSERGLPLGDEPPAALADEVRTHERELRFARERLDACAATIGSTLPEAEYLFVAAHVCTVTSPG